MRQKTTTRIEPQPYADRIKRALAEGPRPMSVRRLANVMKERHPNLRGVSYGGIRQYAEGQVRSPRADLLRAMSDVLGVRYGWLAHGEEPMTDAAARRAQETEWVAQTNDIREEFEAALPGLLPWGSAMNALWELWQLMVESLALPKAFAEEITAGAVPAGTHETGRPLFDVTESQRDFEIRTARRLAECMRSTLNVLGLEPSQLQDDTHRETYVVLLCQALKAAWLSATTETKPRGWYQDSFRRATEAGRQEGADEMLDELQRRFDEVTQGKEKANNGE